MNLHLDFKAIGYGLAAFVVGHMVMSAIGTMTVSADGSSPSKTGWALLQVAGYLVPIIAGYISAYYASHRRIIHGIIGGGLWVIFLLLPAAFVPQYPISSIPIVIVSYGLLAALGAIISNYRRNRAGL